MLVRTDLPAGMQLAQAGHAIADLVAGDHPDVACWQRHDKSLVVLAVADEDHLAAEVGRLSAAGVPTVTFAEPDLAGVITAAATVPHPAARPVVANLPLAGRDQSG